MPIAKNLSSVAASSARETDERPASSPLFAPILAQSWADAFANMGEVRETAKPCRIRHSDAGKCSRALSYGLLGLEVSQPLGLADHYRFNMGTMVHDLFQEVALDLWPTAEVEQVVSFGEPNEYGRVLSAGHGDLTVVLPDPGDPGNDTKTAVHHIELKTINGYGFQRAVGLKGYAQGPRYSAKLQGALNALGADADYLSIVLLSLDVIGSDNAAKVGLEDWQRFSAEWRYDRETFEPWARAELERFNEIVLLTDDGLVAERSIPDPEIAEGALITDPAKGTWTLKEGERIFNAGSTWQCGYCSYRAKCVEDAKAGL